MKAGVHFQHSMNPQKHLTSIQISQGGHIESKGTAHAREIQRICTSKQVGKTNRPTGFDHGSIKVLNLRALDSGEETKGAAQRLKPKLGGAC
jgi:hypothetical protein